MTEGLHRFYGGNDLHFLTFSCYRRRPLFRNNVHCDLFLKILERVRRRYRFVVLGYVVMPEHIHLLVSEPQRETLSVAIQALKLGVVRSLRCASAGAVVTPPRSRKTGETWGTPTWGTLVHPERFWQARFYDFNVWTERKRIESFAISIATRLRAGWCLRLSSGAGAVFDGTCAEKQVRCGSMIRISWQ
jgi:putative transposase